MKKITILSSLFLASTMFFIGCKKDEVKNDDSNSNNTASGLMVEKKNTSLVSKTTATWCGPCGAWGWTLFNDIISSNSDKAIYVGLYASNSASNKNDLFYQASATTLANEWGIKGYPTFSTNGYNTMRYSGSGGIYTTLSKNTTDSAVNSHTNASVLANANNSFKIEGNKVKVNITTKFFEDKAGEYYVATYLLEDKALNIQNGQTGTVEHHYVYRGAFDGKVWGTKINKIGANQTEDFTAEITFQDTWVSKNFKVINVIYKLVNNKYVFVNANSTK